MLQPIVEGVGDARALPVLLRRFVNLAQLWGQVRIGRPLRIPRNQLVKRSGLNKAISLARQKGAGAILILFDSDSDCPAELGPRLQRLSEEVAGGIPCRVVMAHHEYEAWILASVESLRGMRGIRQDTVPQSFPERSRGQRHN